MNNNLNNLMTKYECSYILNMKKKDKDFLKALVKYIKETNFTVKNKTIVTLIYNYFFKKSLLPNVNYITGPFSLSYHYIPSLDKKIYIFGENHVNTHLCPVSLNNTFIVDYIVELLKNTNVFIDFYIEDRLKTIESINLDWGEDYIKDNQNTWGITLETLRHKLLYCRKNKKEQQWCITNRIHQSDVRLAYFYDISRYTDMYENDAELYKIIHYFSVISKIESKEEKIIKLNQIDKILFKKIFNIILISENSIKYLFNEILKNKNIKKQYNKTNAKIKKLIKKYFKQKILSIYSVFINDYFIKEYTSIKNIDTFFDDIYACISMVSFCSNLSVLFMDMYLLCRLFVTYDNTKREDYAPSDQKNIIIYAGDLHSELYRDFILFSKISTININSQLGQYGDEDNCLDMTGIHQPFFS